MTWFIAFRDALFHRIDRVVKSIGGRCGGSGCPEGTFTVALI